MTITIEKINETHIAGFLACLDAVAREGWAGKVGELHLKLGLESALSR